MIGREYILTGPDGDRLKLPVNPEGYEESFSHDNRNFTSMERGEIKAIGRTKLRRLTFGSFFPAQRYPFVTYSDFPPPTECVQKIEKWRLQNKPIRVLITGTHINTAYAIESFTVRKEDGTDDVSFELELEEYRQLNVPESGFAGCISPMTLLRARPNDAPLVSARRKQTSYNAQVKKMGRVTNFGRFREIQMKTWTGRAVEQAKKLKMGTVDAVTSAAPRAPRAPFKAQATSSNVSSSGIGRYIFSGGKKKGGSR